MLHLSFSRDGTRLASASHDGTFKIWDPNGSMDQRVFISLYSALVLELWCRRSQGHRMAMIVAPAVELLRPDPGRLDEIDQMILSVMEVDCKIIWSRDI